MEEQHRQACLYRNTVDACHFLQAFGARCEFSCQFKTSHGLSLREAPWSAAAAATALEYRSVNNRLQIASRSHLWKGGSFAAALQDACGDHGDARVPAVSRHKSRLIWFSAPVL